MFYHAWCFSDVPMNSAFQSGLKYLPAETLCKTEFEEMTFDNLVNSGDGEDKRICLVYLHGKKSTDILKYKPHVKNYMPANKSKTNLAVSYDRFFLFGVPSDGRVVCMFTADERHSKIVTRYHNKMYPGCKIWAMDVTFKGTMNDSENLLIHTEEPLIPLLPSDNTSYIQLLPPYDIDNENDMRYFNFHSTSINLKFPVATTGLCGGQICDGQSGMAKENCVCVEKLPISQWGVRGNIHCEEFASGRINQQDCKFLSVAFSKFVALNHESVKPDSLVSFNPVRFRKSVKAVIDVVNKNGGFSVIGWFKPSKTLNDSFGEVHSYHVVLLKPTADCINILKPLQYIPEMLQQMVVRTTGSTMLQETILPTPPQQSPIEFIDESFGLGTSANLVARSNVDNFQVYKILYFTSNFVC